MTTRRLAVIAAGLAVITAVTIAAAPIATTLQANPLVAERTVASPHTQAPVTYAKISKMNAHTVAQISNGYNPTSRVRLSFDDCATSRVLVSLLDTLRHYRVRAIFFFTGQCLNQHPHYRGRIIQAGQALGNHSADHASYTNAHGQLKSKAFILREIRGGAVGTTRPYHLCRPPYGNGAFSVAFFNIAAEAGCKPAYWTVDTRDWQDGTSAATIARRVLHGDKFTPPARAGGLVLMHGTSLSYQALPRIIRGLRSKGLKV